MHFRSLLALAAVASLLWGATAQADSLNRLGRMMAFGWSDGYHARARYENSHMGDAWSLRGPHGGPYRAAPLGLTDYYGQPSFQPLPAYESGPAPTPVEPPPLPVDPSIDQGDSQRSPSDRELPSSRLRPIRPAGH